MAGELVLVIGKGGVGKTTVARGLGERARGLRLDPLVMELDGDRRSAATAQRFAIEIADGDAALRSVAGEILGSKRLAGALLSHFAVRRLAAIVPGLREVALLVRALGHVDAGRHVIVDMPATGHGLAWLDTVRLLRALEPVGRARVLIDRVADRLADRDLTKLVVVTLSERLVMTETRELCRALPRPPDLVVVNGVHLPPPIPSSLLAAVGRSPHQAPAIAALRGWLRPTDALELGDGACEIMRYPGVPTSAEIAAALASKVTW